MADIWTTLFDDLPQQRSLREKELIKIIDNDGFLCRIVLDADFKLTPEQLMAIFSNPNNTGVFRDIYAVPYRQVVEDDGEGRQKVTVEQVSGFKFLVVPITFSTHLNVERNIKKLTFRYWLNKKGIMKRFVGEWRLSPISSSDDPDKVIGVRAMLMQDLLPSFVPPFCGGFLKNVSRRAVQRIVEDLTTFTQKYLNGDPFIELLKPKHDKHEHHNEEEEGPKMVAPEAEQDDKLLSS